MTLLAIRSASETLQSQFIDQTADLARRLSSGQISLADWQTEFSFRLRSNIVQQFRLGAEGKRLAVGDLDAELRRQTAFLSRFADEVSIRALTDKPLSLAALTARSALYAGAGRAQFFEASERARGRQRGVVYEYQAVDDNRTCGPCFAAEGGSPYLRGEGPMPGDVCRGGGRCRCRRVPVEDPEAYAALTGA